MKQILIFISLFFGIVFNSYTQSRTANQMNGKLAMTAVSNVSDSTWSITGHFTNTVNKYTPSSVQVNDKFFVQIGANTYVGRISVINSYSDVTRLITFRVICNYPNPPNSSSTIGAIVRATSNGYPVWVDGIPNALQAGIQNYFATLINSNAAGNPCEKTITKTNHQFSKGTPVKRVGGTYVRPTNDTIIPDFIVVDSLTANTFKVSTCGIYTSTLPDGLYWYTSASPGYSLTQDTIKVPLFQVLNDTMILNPIVGFNLMSGSSTDNNGIYSGSGSLSQENTYAAMAADESQFFGIGYFPSSLENPYDGSSYGFYNGYGQVSLLNKRSSVDVYDEYVVMNASSQPTGTGADIEIQGFNNRIKLSPRKTNGNPVSLILDSLGVLIEDISGNYRLILAQGVSKPSIISGAITTLTNTGNGSISTPSFLRSQHGVATGTTDGSGDLTVTFAAAMPDATYSLLVTAEGTTYYTTTVHTKATGTVKVRFFDAAGAAVTATSVTLSYEAKDY